MNQKCAKGFRFHIGMRNIKTAIAATLCALIYILFLNHRDPTFACIGAIFGMGSDMADSKLNGGNRLFGTVFGGLIGMGLYYIYLQVYPDGRYHALILLLLFIGVVILVLTSLGVGWPGAIQPGGVVLCILLFTQKTDTFVSYSLNRIFDTAFGVIVAILINILFPRDRVVRWLQKLGIRKLDERE